MIKDWYVHIPPTLCDVLIDIGGTSKNDDFDEIVDAAFSEFFRFYRPEYISQTLAERLEKFILNYYITRRIGSGNVKKWKQNFRNVWDSVMPYYERVLESIEKEKDYFTNPILNADIQTDTTERGTLDATVNDTRNTDTEFNTSRTTNHTGSGTHATDETTGGTHTGTGTHNTDEATSKNGTGTASNTEVNRFSDTPQGDSGKIWERSLEPGSTDVHLTDIYLTDIRGITSNGRTTTTEAGTLDRDETTSDNYTDTGTIDRDETTSETWTDTTTGRDTTDTDETAQSVTDQDTTREGVQKNKGYSGTSPAELMNKYRETFTRTFEDIAAEMEPCFYNLVEIDDLIDFV